LRGGGLFQVLFAEEEGGQSFAAGGVEFHQGGGVGGGAGREQGKAAKLRGADVLGLGDFEVGQFDEPLADLAEVGGVIAALGDAPKVVRAARCRVLVPDWMVMAAMSLMARFGRSLPPMVVAELSQEELPR